MPLPETISALEQDLRGIFGPRLQTLALYGVHANDPARNEAPSAHGHAGPATHSLAVVESLTGEDLRACSRRAAAWHDAGLATPLLLGAHEFEAALDAFPLEFGAILSDHVLVMGRNPFDQLKVDPADVRRACETQARSHLLHLRQGYIETRDRGDALAQLVVRSAAPFAELLKTVGRLQGLAAPDPGSAGRHAERLLNLAGGVATDIVKLADVSEISTADARRLFPPYLDAVERLVAFVDTWT